MPLDDCKDAFKEFEEAGFPPSPSVIHRLAAEALRAAEDARTPSARLSLIALHAIMENIARTVDASAPVRADGAWPSYETLFRQTDKLIDNLGRPHDAESLISMTHGVTDIWMSLRKKPL